MDLTSLVKEFVKMLNPSKPAFGIDLGTTNSVIGYFNDGKVDILACENGERILPSYVSYIDDIPIVGREAQEAMNENPKKVVYDAKRMIGLDYNHSMIQQNKEFWTFTVVEEDNKPIYDIEDGQKFFPEHVSSEILKELKRIALKKLEISNDNERIQAVISVPDYFSQTQKQGTLKAAELAGIDVLVLVTEPNAAALAYGYDHKRFDGYNIFVFDMGGGTCDISILKVKDGKFEIVGRAGDNLLGGRDFDNVLMSHYANKIKDKYKFDVFDPKNLMAKVRLRQVCEEVKKGHNFKDKQRVNLKYVDSKYENEYITQDFFQEKVEDLVKRSQQLCERAIKESGLSKDDIDEVLLVGGSSRMRVIKRMLRDVFRDQEFNESINPDEAVAYGATIRAAQILDGKICPYHLVEKLPVGIGTGMAEDRYGVILERNTPIPSEKVTKSYVTVYNNQKSMGFAIYEGERPIASKNTLLGNLSIKIDPEPAGEVTVPLTMFIDENGILKAYAEYKGNKEQLIIDPGKMSSGDEIQKMIGEAKENEEIDRLKTQENKKRSDMRTNVEHIKYACEKEGKGVTEQLKNTIKEIDEWLSSNKEPLTPEIKGKFISIEDEAKKLVEKYNKNITSFKEKMVGDSEPKSLAIDLYPDFLTYTYSEESTIVLKKDIHIEFIESLHVIKIADELRKILLGIIPNIEILQIVATVPDTVGQNFRKALLIALESLKEKNKLEDVLNDLKKEKFEPKNTRILNRTNAIAIAYSRKLVEDTKKIPFDRKIPPIDLIVFCVDTENCYCSYFKTKDRVLQQMNYQEDPKGEEIYRKIKEFWKTSSLDSTLRDIYQHFIQNLSISERTKIIIAINEQAYHSTDGNSFSSAEWKPFDDGNSLLGNRIFKNLPQLASSNHLSLLGTDTKSRMLCGEVDYIDYDVPAVSLHEVKLIVQNNFEVSAVAKYEQLPIKRTIFKSQQKVEVKIEYNPPIDQNEFSEKHTDNYQAIVSSSGIFTM